VYPFLNFSPIENAKTIDLYGFLIRNVNFNGIQTTLESKKHLRLLNGVGWLVGWLVG